jgi:hypothetical protein
MSNLANLKRRISVLEQHRLKASPPSPVIVVPGAWDEHNCGLDPDAVQTALSANRKAALVVPAPLSAEEWNIASARHHLRRERHCPPG